MPADRPLLVIAWTSVSARQADLAHVLGGEPVAVYPRVLASARQKPLRYLASAVITLVVLARRRPRAVVVTNPPVPAAALVVAWCRAVRVPVVLDSHPGGFGAQQDRLSARLQPLHRWAARRAQAVLVTTEHWVDVVEQWGGRAFPLHEPEPAWDTAPLRLRPPGPPRVLFPGIYGRDEPVAEVVAAAGLLPGVEVQLTGDPAKAPPGLLQGAPVTVLGYLDQPAFRAALRGADVVMSLTTEPTSVMRTACEAVYCSRPLVVSDLPGPAGAFPSAIRSGHDPAELAAAVRLALAEAGQPGAEQARAEARCAQVQRWQVQLAALRAALGEAPAG